jgi:preprotein translocase subunit SecY
MGTRGGVYRRIAVTLLVPIAGMLMVRIPLPGINTVVLKKVFTGADRLYEPGDLKMFALGLMPFISASLLVELLSLRIVRRWRVLRLGGHAERDRLWTRVVIVALVLAVVQAYFIVRWLRATSQSFYMYGDLLQGNPNDFFWIAAQMLSLVAGTFLLYWLTRVIDRYGVGNGFAVIIAGFMVPSVAHELYRLVTRSHYPILMPLGFAAVAVAGITRLAGGRPLKPNVPTGAERLPTPASGLTPVAQASRLIALPAQFLAFTSFEIPEVLMPGMTMKRALEVAVVGALCVLLTWLFNRPRLLAQAWGRGGAPDAASGDRVRGAFARSLAMALAIC